MGVVIQTKETGALLATEWAIVHANVPFGNRNAKKICGVISAIRKGTQGMYNLKIQP